MGTAVQAWLTPFSRAETISRPETVPASRRLHVAMVDEELPYPPTSGKRIRTLNLTLRLARRHHVTYIAYCNADPEEAERARASPVRGVYRRRLRNGPNASHAHRESGHDVDSPDPAMKSRKAAANNRNKLNGARQRDHEGGDEMHDNSGIPRSVAGDVSVRHESV